MLKLTKPQQAIIAAMHKYGFTYIRYYDGPPGASGRGAGFFWPRGKRHANTALPRLPTASVNGLIHRGVLRYAGDGDYELAPECRISMERSTSYHYHAYPVLSHRG